MSKFPDISIIPPTLTDQQFSFDGVLFGQGTPWAVQDTDGIDISKVRSSDQVRPLDSGEFEGSDYLPARDVTLTLNKQSSNLVAQRTLLSVLGAVMVPPEDTVTETPLWFQRNGLPLLCCQVRPRQMRLVSNRKLTYSKVAQPVCQFHATSAYLYGPTQSQTIQVPGVSAGFAFNLRFNLSFGGGGSVGVATINNTGTVSARPVYLFTGPMNTPTILDGSVDGNPFMTFNLVMAPGDLMVVDTDLDGPAVSYFSAGSDEGSSRLSSIAPGSSNLRLTPGTHKLVFSTQDSAPTNGSCEIMWAPTYAVGL